MNRSHTIVVGLGVAILGFVGLWFDDAELSSVRSTFDPGRRSTASRVPASTERSRIVEAARGTVVDDVGAPVEGARVCLLFADDATSCEETDREGRFELRTNVVGTLRLVAGKDGYEPATHGPFVLPVPAIDLVLSEGGARVTGRVVDRAGGPVAGARVLLGRARYPGYVFGLAPPVESGEEGRFAVWAKAGAIALRAEAWGYIASIETGVSPGEILVSLFPGSTLSGRVVDGSSQGPVADANVEVELRATRGGFGYRQKFNTRSDADGAVQAPVQLRLLLGSRSTSPRTK